LEIDWTTFALEAVNFLVLVWILKRFFYRPVLDVIARRRAAIDATLAEARSRHAEAEALEEKSREGLKGLEAERRHAREALAGEIAAERARLLEQMQLGLAEERRKAGILAERAGAEEARRREEQAVRAGLEFTSRLLERLADPALEARLVRMALDDLAALPPERAAEVREAVKAESGPPVATSAGPLPDHLKKAVAKGLSDLLGRAVEPVFKEDPALGAGLRVSLGPWALKASLADELEFFGGAAGPAD
jgi:F-type H+-transporting ATPase subunit b